MSGIVRPQNYKQRELKESKSKFIPVNWLFLDTETKPVKTGDITAHFFQVGWTCLWIRSSNKVYGHSDWIYHTEENKFNWYLHFIATKLNGLIITGHNIFFDLQACGFFPYFCDKGWQLDFYYDQGLTYIMKCTLGKKKITVVSTTNWFDQSLKKLGQNLNLPKLDVDFDSATPEQLKTYCRRDVEIIVKTIKYYLRFIQEHDLGKFSLTKASQAFTAFRHRFLDHKIMIHDNPDVLDLERSAYMGGRVECFMVGQIKGGPFMTLDINAMYPFVMKENKYPWKLIRYEENLSLDRARTFLKSYSVMAEIEIITPVAAFAVKHKGKLIFPIGDFTCFVCSTGLSYALEKGYVRHIIRASVYRRADLFTGYVDFFQGLRVNYTLNNNSGMVMLCKYMHNSLYGKFGQLKIQTEITDKQTGRDYFREDVFSMVTGRTVVITHFMNKQLVQYQEGEGENSNVAIAAHICENARFELWSLMQKAGLKNVLYCDTDSIKIRQKHIGPVKCLIKPGKLGYLKVENESKTLFLGGAKNYRTDDERTIKGIPKKAIEGPANYFSFEQFARQVAHMRTGMVRGAIVKPVHRELKAKYSKGTVLKSGKVKPFIFPPP